MSYCEALYPALLRSPQEPHSPMVAGSMPKAVTTIASAAAITATAAEARGLPIARFQTR